MLTIAEINIAPVKSLALLHIDVAQVDYRGILEDRRFYLIDEQGALLTQRELGRLVQVKAKYQPNTDTLSLTFPNGDTTQGPLESAQPVITRIWGRRVSGRIVEGDWSGALSEFCQMPVQLVDSDLPGQCYDEFPVSLVSQASLDELTRQSSGEVTYESSRFRPTFLLSGLEPHGEDSWVEGTVQVGPQLRLKIVARDPRCSIVTQNPETGDRDMDTLRHIIGYRPNPRAAYLGVYGIIEQLGPVSVGDAVEIIG